MNMRSVLPSIAVAMLSLITVIVLHRYHDNLLIVFICIASEILSFFLVLLITSKLREDNRFTNNEINLLITIALSAVLIGLRLNIFIELAIFVVGQITIFAICYKLFNVVNPEIENQ